MKTKLLIIIWVVFPLFVFSQVNPKEFQWEGEKNYRNNFDVSYLKDQNYILYYLMDNYIKITSNIKGIYPYKVEFENGEVKKISDDVYCVVPNKIGRFNLIINEEESSYKVIELPADKIEFKFSASTSPFPDCVSLDEILKSNNIIASFNNKNFKFGFQQIHWKDDRFYYSLTSCNDIDSLKDSVKIFFAKNIEINSEIQIEGIKIFNPTNFLPELKIKVVSNYLDELIQRTLKLSPETNDLNLLNDDLRIKIIGCPQSEMTNIVNDIANELNKLLETIQVKIVDNQPSLTIRIDTFKYKSKERPLMDSLLKAQGYKNFKYSGYVKEVKNEFFPFCKRFIMYYENICSCNNSKGVSDEINYINKYAIKRMIVGLLTNFAVNNINGSYFNNERWAGELSDYDKQMLKTLYSKGGEEKILSILNEGKVEKQKLPVYILLLVLTIILLFVFSEIYNYYNIGNFIGKVRVKIIKRIIESVLVAQIPIVAFHILEMINNGTKSLFHEVLFLESMLIPFTVLSGVFLLFLDKLLEKVKVLWFNTILNLVMSFFCIALAYQTMYFFITPEFIKLSVVGWEILLIPLLITLYRLYARFQTNKISGLLQEKELELSKQKELKFKSDLNALQARINPHFLYNALNSLASLTHIDSDRTEKMALSLSKLFRYNINKTEEHFASLKDEIEMAEIYLQIEKNRFEEKLNYSIEIEETLNDFVIPKFILQPLAENAVKHGISKIVGKGIIRINIFEQAQKVMIEIYDNGPDFPGGLISGYGLQNTYEKLKLLYKKPFDIAFINTPEKKLVIALTK